MGSYFSQTQSSPAHKKSVEQKVQLEKKQQRDVYARLQTPSSPGEESNTAMNNGVSVVKEPEDDDFPVSPSPSARDETDLKVLLIDPNQYEYPFENLVFEGGGNKGLAYCGVLRVLEEVGVIKNIKRMAGASAGAMTATLAAVGYNSYEIQEFLSQDLSRLFLDASFGVLSLLPNLLRGYGWNPGNRVFEFFGNVLAKKMGDPDITFMELYKKTGFELCIIVTNLNHLSEEYCHPKTTPDMAIRLAVRMSMSIPGMFQAAKYYSSGEENTYVDGGVLCNYPIHCYDGWWLSMKPGDSFLQRLQPLEDLPKMLNRNQRFGEVNNKTLGFLLYSDSEIEMFRYELEQRVGAELAELPNTELARKKKQEEELQKTVHREHRKITRAVNQFLKVLDKHDVDRGGTINRSELENALKDDEFTKDNRELLFDKDYTVEMVFDLLDEDKDGEIEYHELIHFVENKGVLLTQRYLGYQRREINGLLSFFETLQNALLTNVKKVYVRQEDLIRTVGINTGHVGTSDFKLEQGDRDFVVEQGRRSIEGFLKHYVVDHSLSPTKKPIELDHVSECHAQLSNNTADESQVLVLEKDDAEKEKQIQVPSTAMKRPRVSAKTYRENLQSGPGAANAVGSSLVLSQT